MSRKTLRFISFFMSFVLLIGSVPITTFAMDPPAIQEAHSEEYSFADIIGDGTYIQEGITPEGEPGNPMIRILSDGSDKMDTAYLSISLDKYGTTISATDTNSNEVSVLEYTQWQMSARFVRIHEGEVVEDKDVTKECTWISSDITRENLTVTDGGLVTAYGASNNPNTITARYVGKVNVTTGDGTSAVIEKDFVAKMGFNVSKLEFLNDQAEQMRCLALTQLLKNDWVYLKRNAGRTVSDWAAEVQTALLNKASYVPCSDETLAYLNKSNGVYANSARLIHFISAAAGDCIIDGYMEAGESGMVVMGSFSSASQKYVVFQFGYGNVNVVKAERFASEEANGKRRTERMADIQYTSTKKYFQAGLEAYQSICQQNDTVTVTGEFFGGTIAKYVSYMTGCKALTFNAPSPIQYVFHYNLPELCAHYSIYNQKSYVYYEYLRKSTMYSIEPTYYGFREQGCTLPYLRYNGDIFVTIGWTPRKPDKEQSLWNRYVYLGSDERDVYKDTAALTIKLTESAMFGGAGKDELTVKAASKPIIDLAVQSSRKIESVLNWMGLIPDEVKRANWYKMLKGANVIYEIFNWGSRSFLDTNVISGGKDKDVIYGAWRNNSFCITPGGGNDTYVLKGMGNRFFLMGYGDQKVIISHRTSEDNKMLYVTVNYLDQFTIDISNLYFGDIEFYQGSPFDDNLDVVYRIKALYERANVDYWKYSCPVDVLVLDSSGNIVQELKDGQEYSAITDYGVFDVSLENGEYVKSVVLLEEGYSVQARGVGNGTMKFSHTSFNSEEEDGQYCSIENIPVTEGAIYYPSGDLEESIMSVDANGDGNVDDIITFDTTISFAQDAYEIAYGTQQLLNPEITTSSTDRECFWISTDDSVVTVDDDGTLTAVGFGEAEIYAMVADGSGAFDSCKVTVPQETLSAQNFVVTGLEPTYEYTGEMIDVQLSVSYGSFPLLQDVHYTAEFSELIEPGKATLTITGINDYSGTLVMNYEILAPEEPDTVEEKVDWIAAECRKAGITGQWETALWLHDWLVYNATYDYTYTYYHPNGVLLEGTGVCQSYAEAYELLLDEFSIENKLLSAPEMDHAWNLVKIDGEWCHIDCTWDDPGTGGAENHTYFGMNDVLMKRDHVWNTAAYPVSTSNKNYYLIRTKANVVESTQELEDFLGKMAEEQVASFECYYIGEDGNFSLLESFRVWFSTNNWKYGLEGYSIEGSRFMLRVSLSYTEPWDPPADITEPVDCPNFTLRGPDGVYPLKKYSQNGVVLIFGREACGNTQSLLWELHPEVEELKEKGIQVLVNLDGTNVPADYESIKQDYPDFDYTYYDYFLFNKLLEAINVSGSIIYPAVFVINGNSKIISYSTGYVSDFDGLMENILKTASDRPLPEPDPVDENYYGSLFNYTGDDAALAKFIGEQLAERNTGIMARDGTWVDNGEEWSSYPLGNAMMDALDPYRSDPRYEIPYGWSYYLNSPIVVVYINYPEHVEHIPQTVPGKAPTCTETGWTDGSICSVCGITLTEQQIIPATGHTPEEHTDCTAPVNCADCGVELEAVLGHDYVQTVVEPGCATEGYTVHTCSRCGDTYQDQTVSALGHRYEAWIVVLNPTCITNGVESRACSACGTEETRQVDALGHNPGESEKENGTEETCLEKGSYELVVRCTECAEELSRETVEVPATGHSYDSTVVLPTCTERGYTVYTCHCGVSYVGDFVDATGHREIVAGGESATCTQSGLTEGCSCENCGTVFAGQERIPAAGHSWNQGEILAVATTHSDGIRLYICQTCGETKMEILPALEHIHAYTETVTAPGCDNPGHTTYSCLCGDSYTDDYVAETGHSPVVIPAVAATCRSTGLTEGSYCSVCQSVMTEQKGVPALDHAWDEGVITVEPTEEEQGQKWYTCTVCGSMTVVSIPELGHVHQHSATVVEPVCTEQGYTIWLCYCGDYYMADYTDAAGHTEVADAAVAPSCTECGLTEGKHCSVCGEILKAQEHIQPLSHEWGTGEQIAAPDVYSTGLMSYACLQCGEIRTEVIPALEHIHRYVSVVTDPSCENQGYTTFRCECGEEYIDVLADALNHRDTGRQVISEADCTVDGEEVWTCEICGRRETLTVPRTGHLFEEREGSLVCKSCSVPFSLFIQEEYISLCTGKTRRIALTVSPVEFSSRIQWSTDNTSVIEVDETGLVTAVGMGTAYVIVTVADGEHILSKRCRVDVMESVRPDGVQLSTTKATTELFSTDYAELEILLQLPQNYSMTASAANKVAVQNNGVAIDSARFTDDTLANLFHISVLDDRRVQIVPTDYGVESAQKSSKSVASKYTGTITVTVQGKEYETETLTLTVKQSKPKLKASIAEFNSFYSGQTREIVITGGTPTAIYEDATKNTSKTAAMPNWLTLENGMLTLNENAPVKNTSAKAYILVDTEEWRIPAAVTLSVKNTYKAPVLRLSAKTVTLNTTAKDSAVVTVTVSPANYGISKLDFRLTDSTGKVDKTGELTVSYESRNVTIGTTDSAKGNYKLYVSVRGGKEAVLTIKTVSAKPTVTFKVKGSLDLSIPDSAAAVTPTFKNYSGSFAVAEVTVQNAKKQDVTESFTATQDADTILVNCEDNVADGSYTLTLKLKLANDSEISGTAKLTVKRSTVKLKLSASKLTLNKLVGDNGSVSVTSTTEGYTVKDPVWQLMDKTGKNSAEGKLDIVFENGKLIISTNSKTEYGTTYKILVKANDASPASTLTVTIPTEAKSTVTASLKTTGKIDVIRDGSAVTVTPSYKNCITPTATEELFIYNSKKACVNDLFTIEANGKGGYTVTKAEGATLTAGTYKVKLVATFGEMKVESKEISMTVTMATPKLTIKASNTTLFAKDKNDRAIVCFETKDAALNEVSKVEIKDAKYLDKFEVISYGNGEFAIGFKDGKVDESLIGKSVTVTLNIFIEGNQTSKANATAKLKVTIVK